MKSQQSKDTSRKRNPLTLYDRECIQAGLQRGMRVSEIAKSLGRTSQTIADEIKRNVTTCTTGFTVVRRGNICTKRNVCPEKNLCDKDCGGKECRKCEDGYCNTVCEHFSAKPCPKLEKSPFCCNGCEKLSRGRGCESQYKLYNAKSAHKDAEKRRSEARKGIDSDSELHKYRDEIISEGIFKGQSPAHILENNPELNMSLQTMYNHLNRGVYAANRMHLKDAVNRRARKTSKGKHDSYAIPRELLKGREYDDWLELSEAERLSTVQMDTVLGRKSDKQCILSLQWKTFALQIYLLLSRKNAANVVEAFDQIQSAVGLNEFRRMIPCLLTDRGTEFSDVYRIEHDAAGNKRCRVFFCDAYKSQQKPNAERAHRELRWILPKGKSNFDALRKVDMHLLSSHVNSISRPQLAGATPLSLAKIALAPLLDALSIAEIPANEVVENPQLLPHAMLPGTGLSGRKGLAS